MNLEVILIVIVASLASLALGWVLGSRIKAAALEGARAEGHAELSIEVARLQERSTFLEQTSQEQREHASVLASEVQRAGARALSAETEAAQLRERVSTIADLEKAQERAEASALNALASLSEQRELAGRLTAQIEAAASSTQEFQRRIAQLTDIEQALRRELAQRESELVTQREVCCRFPWAVMIPGLCRVCPRPGRGPCFPEAGGTRRTLAASNNEEGLAMTDDGADSAFSGGVP